MKGRPHALTAQSSSTFWRSLQTLNATRIAIAAVLLLYLVFERGPGGRLAYIEVCLAYLLLAIGFALLTANWRHRFRLQLLAQLALDIGFISLLYLDVGGVYSGLAILYMFPLAGAAILAPLVPALFCAALVSLFMLAESTYQIFVMDGASAPAQAGLYGAAFFAVVLVLSRLAAGLIGQEALALQRGNALAVQQAINRLVMADMGDGILVLGHDGQVFTCNPAARQMLGLAHPESEFRLGDAAALAPVRAAYGEWLEQPSRSSASAVVSIKPYDEAGPAWGGRREHTAHLKLRFASVDTAGLAAARSVIFLQDVSEIENQAQQLKLASMGRLTASIAHEVRNPLSAIGHAAALLGEELTHPLQMRLLRIVADNVDRVNRMIEDILQLSRKVQQQDEALALAPLLAGLKAEVEQSHGVDADVICLGEGAPTVRFDPLHLREVVLNLLHNAVRYASRKPCSIRLRAGVAPGGRVELQIGDDGPGMTAEVRAHLFEPFYTTSSQGTGLGLYLARELCLNNGAALDYEYRRESDDAAGAPARGRFVITFAAA
ncbi:MAG: PAS domain-containing protein [Burkholderiaceae bacterium]|nr:PAS domain-containing protein [Burkholderiaceae bacterium]